MRQWVVGGALIEEAGGVLLVCNRRRNGSCDWTPPGGVIDDGERLLDGLAREVAEETGLVVTGWEGPVYEVVAEAPGLGWRLRAEVHRATGFAGRLAVDDPDGIVVDARFFTADECAGHLDGVHQWVREPLADWLRERWGDTRRYAYRIDGDSVGAIDVTRRRPSR